MISYTGGVAHNIIWNSLLKKKYKNLIIPPHSSDEGLSLGAIEYLRIKNNLKPFKLNKFPFIQYDESPKDLPSAETITKIAKLLSENKTVGWYQEHGEIGPRALGNRSLLVSPLNINNKIKMNEIKKRETYRPFGASVLEEDVDFIDHYMISTQINEKWPIISHVDKTSRIQTVNKEHTHFYNLLKEFKKITNCSLLLNTSMNLRGFPIVGTINKAKELFHNSSLDCLVVGNSIYLK